MTGFRRTAAIHRRLRRCTAAGSISSARGGCRTVRTGTKAVVRAVVLTYATKGHLPPFPVEAQLGEVRYDVAQHGSSAGSPGSVLHSVMW